MVCRTILCVARVYCMSWCVELYCVLHVYFMSRCVERLYCALHVLVHVTDNYSNEQCLVCLGLDLTITWFDISQELLLEFDELNWKSCFLMKTATFILFFDWR